MVTRFLLISIHPFHKKNLNILKFITGSERRLKRGMNSIQEESFQEEISSIKMCSKSWTKCAQHKKNPAYIHNYICRVVKSTDIGTNISVHTEKSFLNLVNLAQIWIVITIFPINLASIRIIIYIYIHYLIILVDTIGINCRKLNTI